MWKTWYAGGMLRVLLPQAAVDNLVAHVDCGLGA